MKKLFLIIGLVGLISTLTTITEAADITAQLDEALGASAFVVQDSASTTMTSVDSDGNVVIKGGVRLDSAGTEYTTAEDLIVDGNIGVNDITPDARLDVDNTTASVDTFGITHSASADGINAAEISFTQQDDADALDTNAGINLTATSSSLLADTLVGINIGNITAGTATENAIRIGTGWDSNIVITEDAVSKTKIDLASSAGNAKWIAIDSGWVLSFVNDNGFKFYNSSGAGKAFGTNTMSIENSAIYMYIDPVVGSTATNRWLKMYGNIMFEESDDYLGTWSAYTITFGNVQGTTTATTFQFGRTGGIDVFNFNTTATYNFKTLSSSGTDDITLTPAGGDVVVNGTLGIREGGASPAYYTIFQGGDQAANVTYTLPTADGTSGQVLSTNGAGVLSWAPGFSTVKITADQTNSTTTLANITGLSFSVSANSYYHIEFLLVYQTAATTTGLKLAVTYPAATVASYQTYHSGQAADGTDAEFSGAGTSSGDAVTSTAVVAASTNYRARISMIIVPSSSGTVQAQFASEVAASNAIIKQGSMGMMMSY